MSDRRPPPPEPWLAVDEDPLTGLRNLLGLISDLSGPLAGCEGYAVGLDVCGLAAINSEKGREAGDQVLVAVARALQAAAQASRLERVNLYRLGGDEFCALVCGGNSRSSPFLKRLEDSVCPQLTRRSLVELGEGWGSPHESFIDLWLPLERGLRHSLGDHESPLRFVARRLAQQVKETLEQLKDTRRLAFTDDVSGLPNHRAATHRMNDLLASTGEPDGRFSILFIDGDNLRRYNDDLGYAAGNEMIRRLGAVISGATLPGEMVARWLSGDEFMVVLPGYTKAQAVKKAESICKHRFSPASWRSTTAQAVKKAESICKRVRDGSAGWAYPVTVSVGAATWPEDANSLEELLSRAEQANATAKSLGKNRVCCSGSTR